MKNYLIVFILILTSCKTLKAVPEDHKPDNLDLTGLAQETKQAEQLVSPVTPLFDDSLKTGNDGSQFILSAEDLLSKIDTYIDVDLKEPLYNLPAQMPSPEATRAPELSAAAQSEAAAPKAASPETTAAQSEAAAPTAATQPAPQPAPPPPPPPPQIRKPQPAKPKPAAPDPKSEIQSSPKINLSAANTGVEIIRKPQDKISRTVNAMVGQIVEVPYTGAQWVFLGEQNGLSGLDYEMRRTDEDGLSFIFKAKKEGSYLLKFYKKDYVKDYYINDFVQVVVSENSPAKNGFGPPDEMTVVTALPRWPGPSIAAITANDANTAITANDETEQVSEQVTNQINEASAQPIQAKNIQSVSKSAAPSASSLMESARQTFKDGKFAETVEALDNFRRAYPAASDEAWWFYGQCFEAPGKTRDIRSSMDAYKMLVNEYPQSKYFDDAEKRIAYLNKFYFNIR
ncbi:MAG: hypothetical protein Ta2G_16650 [Termitinemataceae bacterium]|nr:MAG: hypothetical protein Ta2G_16650 [Termitinemataceae bacterium]